MPLQKETAIIVWINFKQYFANSPAKISYVLKSVFYQVLKIQFVQFFYS